MINKLTLEQEKALKTYYDKWLAIGLSTNRINRPEAIKNFMIFNELVLGRKKRPVIVFMDSPLTTWLATLLLYNFIYNKDKSQVWSQVESQVWSQVESQVWSQVESQVGSQVWSQVESFINPYLGGNFDSGYFSFYDFFNKELKIQFKEQKKWDCYLRTSDVSLIYPFEKFVVISEKPIEIKMKDMRLHNEKGMAVKYADGFGLYALNGVRVNEEIVMTPPEKLDPELLIKETNAEIRREIIRKIGMNRILQKLNAKKLDSWREYELYKLENIDIEPVQVLKMVCPSKGIIYSLRVPPEIKTAREAITWTNNGVDPEKFLVES